MDLKGEEEPPEEVCLSRPCAVDDSFAVPKNFGPKEFLVLWNDLNFDGHTGGANLLITAVSPAANGVVQITGSATTVTYTTPLDFVGQDTFTYTIEDTSNFGDGPTTATVTVDVES